MKKIAFIIASLFLMQLLIAQKNETCVIKTELGNITVELYGSKAPITVANFLKYADAHLYDSGNLTAQHY